MVTSTWPEESVRTGINRCVEACVALVQVSEDCAAACLALEGNGEITHCFLADLDCIEVCSATSRLLSWHVHSDGATAIAMLETCRESCSASVEACERMAELYPSWLTCTMACRRVMDACGTLLAAL
ncbi:four-helix bundle copper-binding protein [Cryobacterium sp. TMT2-10]|uniref:Four-helix bundle copper-binding protein n=1 Tax=Cryobacterium shii TaxID=1259235 RepID=A0AAQ2C8P6_9MICO|nr:MULTISPECIES: four-helix bundle copper-binding protein [Cryobacterium]TFC52348.1 four-helix bundle copper-binding protein [Cryobacterium shii]TFD16508.1 four-helix bundle copper-binding protein [Cryobacterium sp. TMT2-23]TFD20476.1 four-helix bundle copper-binding protein [Cryobacterium sp. TMT4-10]TFD35239.1 four-helix bundle copper-binding protein [Cryobacterium sp. TMT2-10]